EVQRDGQPGAEHERDENAEADLQRGDQQVVPEERPVVPQRPRDLARGREDEVVDAAELGVELPGADERDEDEQGRDDAASAPHGRSASNACSRAASTAGSVAARPRGPLIGSSATTRPGRADRTTTRSASTAASSTSCVTRTAVRGSR